MVLDDINRECLGRDHLYNDLVTFDKDPTELFRESDVWCLIQHSNLDPNALTAQFVQGQGKLCIVRM